jgi:hypothetical protein
MPWKTPVAFGLVVLGSVGGSALAANQAGEQGAQAGRAEIQRAARQYVVDQREQLIRGCHRSNRLREESNERIPAHNTEAKVLTEFLKTAETARMAAYRRDQNPEDLMAARQYREGQRLMRTVRFKPLPLVDCERAYPPVRR